MMVIILITFIINATAQNQDIHKKAWEYYNAGDVENAHVYFTLLDSIGYATNDSTFITDATIFLSG